MLRRQRRSLRNAAPKSGIGRLSTLHGALMQLNRCAGVDSDLDWDIFSRARRLARPKLGHSPIASITICQHTVDVANLPL